MAETQSLDGSDLDIAVARARIACGALDVCLSGEGAPTILLDGGIREPFHPSVSWAHAGPIIEAHGIGVARAFEGHWVAFRQETASEVFDGRTPLIAAMRAYVASKA